MVQTNGNGAESTVRTVNIEMRKHSGRRLEEDVIIEHVAQLRSVVNTNGSKWSLELAGSGDGTQWLRQIGGESGGPRDYAVFFKLVGPNSTSADLQVDEHIAALAKKGSQIKGTHQWLINRVNGAAYIPLTAEERIARTSARAEGMVTYADVDLPKDTDPYFKDLYGLSPQIRMMLRYMKSAMDSNFEKRFHALLVGDPGCGKSHTLTCAQSMFGKDAVVKFDGTAMTSAGITKELNGLDVMPRFIFIEEIDKAPNDAVAVLLGIMDSHGELRKTTYRDNIAKDCRAVVFATANSWTRIQEMQMGAVASRFGNNPIVYGRPDDEMLRQILNRELDSITARNCTKPSIVDGKPIRCDKCANCSHRNKWIARTLEWCKKVDNRDPRYVISVCLNGQDELLDGTFQADLEATMFPMTNFADQ